MDRKEYKREYDKKYRIKNKAKKNEYNKRYYQSNQSRMIKQSRKYNKKNKHKTKEYDKKYRQKSKGKIKEKNKKYYQSNQSRMNKQSREYRENNKEYLKEYGKKYCKTEKGKEASKKHNRKRRAFKMCIIEDFSNKEWLQKLKDTFGVCPRCNTYVGMAHLELDHFYPVSLAYEDFKKTGIKRIYTIDDIQPLCKSCNSKKHNKLETENKPF